MAETPDRLCDNELYRRPSAGSWKLYYTATATTYFGLGVCNTTAQDVHVSVFLIGVVEGAAAAWTDGALPPPYTEIVSRQRIEADGGQGNVWEMPVVILRADERIAVFTDLVGVNFNGHGIRQT